jgi:hypothetical protein
LCNIVIIGVISREGREVDEGCEDWDWEMGGRDDCWHFRIYAVIGGTV